MLRLAAWLSPSMSIGLMRENTGPANFKAGHAAYQSTHNLFVLRKKVVRDETWQLRLRPPYGGANPGDQYYPQPFPPAAKTAPIVSIEAVSADPSSALEEHITSNYQDATALEMEGYGAIFAAEEEGRTPCIIIRGISDDRAAKDPKLDKIHQPIAAAHGAAFAYELLDYWGDNRRAPERTDVVDPPSTIEPAQQDPGPVDTLPIQPAPIAEDVLDETSIAVLSFAGSEADFPQARQKVILDVIRNITGNPAIEIVGSQAGSFYLFLRVNEPDLVSLQSPELRSALSEKAEARLLGVASKEDFERSRQEIEELLTASRSVLDWPRALPDGTVIERPEINQLLEPAPDHQGRTKAVIGDPGSGKTALLAALAERLRNSRIPFLAIKADILDTSITSENDLQRDLGLSDLPSRILTWLSRRGPVYLIIDQLDALAGYVDLRTGRLSVLLSLIRALGNQPNVCVVVSARRFEYEHDTRLKSVQAESVFLDLPPWSEVLKILESHGIQAAGWPTDAQQVIRSPQSLATLLKLTGASQSVAFDEYQKMLERLWQERILNRPDGSRVATLAGRIAEEMASKETLWLARSRYDAENEDLKTLLAEGILTTSAGSPGSIGFSHQTVFEFALARSFAQADGRLSSYIQERVASLFVRPKLWAALTYLRGVEVATYEHELRAIWALPNLRAHLRNLVIEFIGQQNSPIASEVTIMKEAMGSPDRRLALQAILRSSGWFELFKNTEITKAMTDVAEAGIASAILSRAGEYASDDVIELLERNWLPDTKFDSFAWYVLQDNPEWSDRHLALATTIVQRIDVDAYAFDHMVSTVGTGRPVMAIKLVRSRLDVMLKKAATEALSRAESINTQEDSTGLAAYMSSPAQAIESVIERSEGWDTLEALGKSEPAFFVRSIWPWFQEALEAVKRYKNYASEFTYPLSHNLDFRFESEGTLDLPEPSLLAGLRSAVEQFAAADTVAFKTWFDEAKTQDAAPAQRLLAHALSTQPEIYASFALEFLLGDDRRFHLGNIEDASETTKRLIVAVSPFWTREQIDDFVAALLSYAPRPVGDRDAKSRQNFYQLVGQTRYELAACLPKEKMPSNAIALVQEGERKFGSSRRGATFYGPTWVGPSMSPDAMGHAADEDILNAFQELPDETGWDNPKNWRHGGNVQLSRSFADFAKNNPNRAIELMRQFTPDIGARAVGYAIDAMAEAVDPSLLLPLIREFDSRGFSTEEYRDSVARAVEKLINRGAIIDDITLSIVEGWLGSAAVPVVDNDADSESIQDDDEIKDIEEEKDSRSILWGMGGLSILPHGNFPILEAIARIYLQRKNYDRLLEVFSQHLDRPEEEKVWQALFRLFPYIRTEKKSELASFYRVLFEKYPALAISHEAILLFAHIHWALPDLVRDIISGWKDSPTNFAQQAYGELSSLIWLTHKDLAWAANMVRGILESENESPMRVGAAYAAVHVWADIPDNKNAPILIRDLTLNASGRTWAAIIDLFRLVDEISPDPDWVMILQAIAEEIPRQPNFGSHFVTERLQTLLPHEATLVASIVKGLVDKWRNDLGDVRTSHASIAPELVDIAITLHRLNDETRLPGLEIFEQLLAINAYTARETLDQVDNRFRSTQPPQRTRLPRRNRQSRRARRRSART
ncbi:tetratricopeptide (TPR) repeat protein [Bradyrhizobium sp. LB9.1b]